jgi:hypothetical protein
MIELLGVGVPRKDGWLRHRPKISPSSRTFRIGGRYPPRGGAAYFDPGLVIRDTEKQRVAMLFGSTGVMKRLARLLVEHADPTYLVAE